MGIRLDVTDPEVISSIEEKFTTKKANAVIEAEGVANKLFYSIEYYKSHSLEEICADVRNQIKEKTKDKDFKETEAVLNKELERAKTSFEFFNKLDGQTMTEFTALYQEMYLGEEIYKARTSAIKETATEYGVSLPLCLANEVSVSARANKIISLTDTNEKERSLIGKMTESLRNDKTNAALIAGTSVMVAACQFVNYTNHRADIVPALLSSAGVFALSMAILTTLYNASEIKEFFKDTRTVEEAKKLGLLNLLVNWGTAEKKFSDYQEKVQNTKTPEGGRNGLH